MAKRHRKLLTSQASIQLPLQLTPNNHLVLFSCPLLWCLKFVLVRTMDTYREGRTTPTFKKKKNVSQTVIKHLYQTTVVLWSPEARNHYQVESGKYHHMLALLYPFFFMCCKLTLHWRWDIGSWGCWVSFKIVLCKRKWTSLIQWSILTDTTGLFINKGG